MDCQFCSSKIYGKDDISECNSCQRSICCECEFICDICNKPFCIDCFSHIEGICKSCLEKMNN